MGSAEWKPVASDRRLRLLTDHIDLLRAAFRYGRARHPFTVDAIVVLPDHLHAIFSLPNGDAGYALRLRLIRPAFHATYPQANTARQPAWPRPNAGSGNGATRSDMMGIATLHPSLYLYYGNG